MYIPSKFWTEYERKRNKHTMNSLSNPNSAYEAHHQPESCLEKYEDIHSYFFLRTRASLLILEKPKDCKINNWTKQLKDVFTDGKSEIRCVFEQHNNLVHGEYYSNSQKENALRIIVTKMRQELQVPVVDAVAYFQNRNEYSYIRQNVLEFMTEVNTFLCHLFMWIEDRLICLIKTLDQGAKGKLIDGTNEVIHEVLEQGLDLLWGIFS